jgi:hypothetical protein
MAITYHSGERGLPGFLIRITGTDGQTRGTVIPAMTLVDSNGGDLSLTGMPVTTGALTATTDRSGTATTTSGGLNVPANAARKFLVGQNLSAVNIGFNEQGTTAVIGTAGTYTVPAGQAFSISTNKLINFIAASGTAAVTLTEG